MQHSQFFSPSAPNWKHIFCFLLSNLLRERQERQRGWSDQGVKSKHETDTGGIKDILYSLPINLPHHIVEICPSVCGRCSLEPSRVEFSAHEKVFSQDTSVCQFDTICEHLERWRTTLVSKPQNIEQYIVSHLSH